MGAAITSHDRGSAAPDPHGQKTESCESYAARSRVADSFTRSGTASKGTRGVLSSFVRFVMLFLLASPCEGVHGRRVGDSDHYSLQEAQRGPTWVDSPHYESERERGLADPPHVHHIHCRTSDYLDQGFTIGWGLDVDAGVHADAGEPAPWPWSKLECLKRRGDTIPCCQSAIVNESSETAVERVHPWEALTDTRRKTCSPSCLYNPGANAHGLRPYDGYCATTGTGGLSRFLPHGILPARCRKLHLDDDHCQYHHSHASFLTVGPTETDTSQIGITDYRAACDQVAYNCSGEGRRSLGCECDQQGLASRDEQSIDARPVDGPTTNGYEWRHSDPSTSVMNGTWSSSMATTHNSLSDHPQGRPDVWFIVWIVHLVLACCGTKCWAHTGFPGDGCRIVTVASAALTIGNRRTSRRRRQRYGEVDLLCVIHWSTRDTRSTDGCPRRRCRKERTWPPSAKVTISRTKAYALVVLAILFIIGPRKIGIIGQDRILERGQSWEYDGAEEDIHLENWQAEAAGQETTPSNPGPTHADGGDHGSAADARYGCRTLDGDACELDPGGWWIVGSVLGMALACLFVKWRAPTDSDPCGCGRGAPCTASGDVDDYSQIRCGNSRDCRRARPPYKARQGRRPKTRVVILATLGACLLLVIALEMLKGQYANLAARPPDDSVPRATWNGPDFRRIGEAANPGPKLPALASLLSQGGPVVNMIGSATPEQGTKESGADFTIITANVAAARPKATIIASWNADLTMLQETKLTTAAIIDFRSKLSPMGKMVVHGVPCRTIKRDSKKLASAAKESAKGGVAAVLRGPRTPVKTQATKVANELRATARWEEIVVPARADASHLGAATLYGISGASSNPRAYKENEALLAKAVLRMVEFGDVPYIIAGDINIEPCDSEVLSSAIEAGILVDVGYSARKGQEPELTYRRKGPYQGMERDEEATSRIDVILANPIAASSIKNFRPRWDLVLSDHVPLEVTLDVGTFVKDVVVHDGPTPIDVEGIPHVDQQVMDAAYQKAYDAYGSQLEDYIEHERLDDAHETWSKLAETYIEVLRGREVNQIKIDLDNRPARTAPPTFKRRRVTAPTGNDAEPTTLYQRQLIRARNRAVEARARIQRWCKHNPQNAWHDLQSDHPEKAKVTCIWNKMKHNLSDILGKNFCSSLEDDPSYCSTCPTIPMLDAIVNKANAVNKQEQDKRRSRDYRDMKAYRKWDMEKNHSRKAFARIRANYKPPTTSLRDPKQQDKFTFDQQRIHQLFADKWAAIYRMHARQPPNVDKFKERYAEYIPKGEQLDGMLIDGADLCDQARRMKQAGHGFDGWTVSAVKLLTWQLWQDRMRVERLAYQLATLPTSYYHAPNAMIPKEEGDTPLKHRGITVFSVVHRVMTGAYWHKLQDWQRTWIHPSLYGARPGGEILLDAWDVQADIEAASVEDAPCIGALLDYEKCFDLFDPALAQVLFTAAGLPRNLAAQMTSMYSRLTRYIKVAGTYGATIRQTNGCPQGCSFSLLLANLYVSTLFYYLEREFPQAGLGAYLDDRNLRHHDPDELKRMLDRVCEFDKHAGHRTNIGKSALFGNTKQLREQLRQIQIDGQSPPISLGEKMVGHTVVTRRATITSSLMNGRAEEMIKRAAKIADSNYSYRQRLRLVEASAVPVSWCGCQWSLPTVGLQAKAANTIVTALWGKKRKLRSKEIILAVLHDPTRVDPVASMVFRRLLDARRALKQSQMRHQYAVHVNELMEHGAEAAVVGPVHGLRAAARAIGGRLCSDQDGLYYELLDGEPPIHMTRGSCKVWKRRIKDRLRKTIIASLDARTVPHHRGEEETNGRTRKDFYGITDRVDMYATTMLRDARPQPLPKCLENVAFPDDPKQCCKDPVWRQRLDAVLSGSVRAFDRLDKAGLCEGAHCHLCGCPRGDTDHVMWECPLFAEARAPYLDALRTYRQFVAERSQNRATWITELLKKPCVRNCGVLPEDPVLHSGLNMPTEQEGSLGKPVTPEHQLSPEHRDSHRHRDGRIVVAVDGSASDPDDWRRTRAGWSVFVSEGHPWNSSGHLPGQLQSSYRAELAAAMNAIITIPRPIHILSDCQGIVDGVQEIIDGGKPEKGDCEDLWRKVKDAITARPRDDVAISWIKSHIPHQVAAEVELAGGFIREDIAANDWADELAKKGAATHHVPRINYQAADDRAVVAQVVQRMQVNVWAEFLQLVEEAQEEDDTSRDDQCAMHELDALCPHADADEPNITQPQPGERTAEQALQDIGTDWTTSQIATALRARPTDYCWALEDAEYTRTVKFVLPSVPFDYSKGAYSMIKGRGRVSTGIDESPIVLEALVWWFNSLRWTPHWTSRPHTRLTHQYTSSFAELVVDFEATTGIQIPAQCWHEKATKIASLLRALAKVHTVEVDGNITCWKQALDPQVNYPPLTPLGGPRGSGYGHRPRWLSSTTTDVAAANVWRCLQKLPGTRTPAVTVDTDTRGAPIDSANNVPRTFLKGHVINRSGCKQVVVWKTRAEREIALLHAEKLRKYYEAVERWQSNPIGPMPRHPSTIPIGQRGETAPVHDLDQGRTSQPTATPLTSATGAALEASSETSANNLLRECIVIPCPPPGAAREGPLEPVARGAPLRATSSSTTCSSHAASLTSPASGTTSVPRVSATFTFSANPCSRGQSASSNGSTSVPIVRTSLREIREDITHHERVGTNSCFKLHLDNG